MSGEQPAAGTLLALQLAFSLPPSTYATMLVRELTKQSTATAVHRAATQAGGGAGGAAAAEAEARARERAAAGALNPVPEALDQGLPGVSAEHADSGAGGAAAAGAAVTVQEHAAGGQGLASEPAL